MFFRAKRAVLRARIQQIRAALRKPQYDDEAALERYNRSSDEDKRFRLEELEGYIRYWTASIGNSYLKAQISSGLDLGVIAFFGAVIWQRQTTNWFLVIGIVLNAMSIMLLRMVANHRPYIWFEVVPDYGVEVYKHLSPLSGSRFLEKRKRAIHNRWMLLRNRRLTFAALWFFAMPGLLVGLMAFSWVAVCVAIVVCAILSGVLRRFINADEPPELVDVD
jgi:hypothetical protein